MATITSGSRSGGGKTFTVGDIVYFTNYSTSLDGSAGSNSGYTMPWHGKITKLYDTTYTNWIYTQSNADAAGKTSSYAMLIRPSWATKGYKITVTYSHSGGTGTPNQTGYVGASLTGTSSKTGYTFAGWYTSGGSKVTTIPSSATTYYAHWTANSYNITLNLQGGSGGTTSVKATYGNAMPAITIPTRTGYTFGGYYTSANGGGTQYYTAAGASARSMTNAGALTLYAKWTANTYSIHFEGNGATSGSMSDQSFTYDVSQLLTQNGFSRGAAYRFAGWDENPNIDPRTDTPTYTDAQSVINLRSESGAAITLYAIWRLYYIAPEITSEVVATRTAWSEEAHSYVLDDQGTCFHIEFDWKVDQIVPTEVGTTNYIKTIVLKYKESNTSAFDVLHVETFDTNMTSGSFKYDDPMNRASIEKTYDIIIELTDTYGETIEVYGPQTVVSAFVSKAFFTMDFAVGGYGIGIGTPAPSLPERGMNVAMDTTFINELNTTLEYDDEDAEYYNGLNDRAVLSPGTIAKIESMLGLPESPFDYDPWWADPDSPVTLQNVANFISTFTPEHLTAEDFGLTTSTGTLTGFDAYRVGRIIHIQMSGQNSAAVSAGSNVYVGTVTNEKYWPIVPVSSSSYYGQYDFGIYFYSNNGQIVVRNNNYGQSSPASNHPGFGFTYIMAGQPNYEYTLPTDAGTNSGSSGGSDLSVNYRYNAIPTSPVFVRNDVTQEWKLAGSALNGSTDWVTIPESATEVCVIMQGTTSSWDNTYRSSSPVIGLGDRWMIGGYYAGSSDYGYANVNIQNNGRSYQIRNHFYSSQNIKSSTNMYVYYKEADVDRLDHTNISVWQAEWIASSTSANGTSLTNSITVPAGTYIIVGQAPSASATTVCTLSGITPAKYFAIGDLGTFERICTLNSETTIKITSSQSASVTYSNLTRGGLTITKLA